MWPSTATPWRSCACPRLADNERNHTLLRAVLGDMGEADAQVRFVRLNGSGEREAGERPPTQIPG
jgi:hypothetical protein